MPVECKYCGEDVEPGEACGGCGLMDTVAMEDLSRIFRLTLLEAELASRIAPDLFFDRKHRA